MQMAYTVALRSGQRDWVLDPHLVLDDMPLDVLIGHYEATINDPFESRADRRAVQQSFYLAEIYRTLLSVFGPRGQHIPRVTAEKLLDGIRGVTYSGKEVFTDIEDVEGPSPEGWDDLIRTFKMVGTKQ